MKGTIIMSFMATSSLNVFGKNSVTPKIDPCIHVTLIEKNTYAMDANLTIA